MPDASLGPLGAQRLSLADRVTLLAIPRSGTDRGAFASTRMRLAWSAATFLDEVPEPRSRAELSARIASRATHLRSRDAVRDLVRSGTLGVVVDVSWLLTPIYAYSLRDVSARDALVAEARDGVASNALTEPTAAALAILDASRVASNLPIPSREIGAFLDRCEAATPSGRVACAREVLRPWIA